MQEDGDLSLGSLEVGVTVQEDDYDYSWMTEDEFQTAVDDVSGKTLDADKVKAARQLELDIINQYGV